MIVSSFFEFLADYHGELDSLADLIDVKLTPTTTSLTTSTTENSAYYACGMLHGNFQTARHCNL